MSTLLLVTWMSLIPITILLNIVFKLGIDINTIIYISSACCMSYMGCEYTVDFLRNKKLPKGNGNIEKIKKYKGIVITWLIYSLISIILISINKDFIGEDTINTLLLFSGVLSIELIAGNKINKIATNSLGKEENDENNNI